MLSSQQGVSRKVICTSDLIRKKHFRNLRTKLKGARLLRDNDKPFLIAKTVSSLSSVSTGIDVTKIPSYLVGVYGKHVEVLLKQLLLKKYTTICGELMYAIGSGKDVEVALPHEWISAIDRSGFNVNYLGSKIKLYKYSFFCLFKGLVKVLRLLMRYNSFCSVTKKPYVVFLELSKNNLPLQNVKKRYDVISWYQKKFLNNHNKGGMDIWAVIPSAKRHTIEPGICVTSELLPKYDNLLKLTLYASRMFVIFMPALLGILRGRWWYGPLYEESVQLNYVTKCNNKQLANEYLFHNSGWFYKPLWTYDVESRGSKITLYYYSTNIENMEFNGYKTVTYGLDLMRWKSIYVWDKEQKDYLKKDNNKAKYNVVGTLDFVDGAVLPDINRDKFNIAIFDITPVRLSSCVNLGYALPPYYSEWLVLRFYSHIIRVMADNNICLLLKQKRDVDHSFVRSGFIKKQNIIIGESFKVVEPNVSASRLVESVDAVISLPFTATSIIGKNNGIPTIYYDPSGTILKEKHHDVPVLKNVSELFAWKLSVT